MNLNQNLKVVPKCVQIGGGIFAVEHQPIVILLSVKTRLQSFLKILIIFYE